MSRRVKTALALALCTAWTGLAVAACGGEPRTNEPSAKTEATGTAEADLALRKKKCSFSNNVLALFDASTNGTALPSTDLGIGCTDTMKTSSYNSLFP